MVLMTNDNERLLSSYIDHSVLKINTTKKDILNACDEALEYKFRSLVVHPCYAKLIIDKFRGSCILTAVVVDFPHGRGLTATRENDVNALLDLGVDEIDLVSKYHLLFDNGSPENFKEFKDDISSIANIMNGKTLKIILEIDALNDTEINSAVLAIYSLVKENDFKNLIIKTKTGFAENIKPNLNTVQAIYRFLNQVEFADQIKIKASGGIKTKEDALDLIEAGASILGTSSGIAIISDKKDSCSAY